MSAVHSLEILQRIDVLCRTIRGDSYYGSDEWMERFESDYNELIDEHYRLRSQGDARSFEEVRAHFIRFYEWSRDLPAGIIL